MLHFQSSLVLSHEVPGKWTLPPGPPMGPLCRGMPISRAFFYTTLGTLKSKWGLLIQQNVKFLSKSRVKEPLHPFFPTGPLWREMLHFQSQWFIHSFISLSPQLRTSPTKWGKTYGHCPWSPTRTEVLHTMGCSLVPPGDRLWHCYHYSSAMQPSAQYVPPLLR